MIRARVTLDEKYYFQIYWDYYFGFERIIYGLVTSISFGLFIIIFISDRTLTAAGSLIMIFAIVLSYLLIFHLLSLIYSLYAIWKRGQIDIVDYEFSDDGVELVGENYLSKIKWSYFKAVRETRSDFKLYPIDGSLIRIPKLSFTKLEDLVRMKDLISRKVGDR